MWVSGISPSARIPFSLHYSETDEDADCLMSCLGSRSHWPLSRACRECSSPNGGRTVSLAQHHNNVPGPVPLTSCWAHYKALTETQGYSHDPWTIGSHTSLLQIMCKPHFSTKISPGSQRGYENLRNLCSSALSNCDPDKLSATLFLKV